MALKKYFIINLALSVFILLAFSSCEYFWGVSSLGILSDITTYNPPTSFNYKLSSSAPSASASHTLSFDFSGETLETYKIVLTYPSGFKFSGFTSLGGKNTKIGFYKLDAGSDKNLEANFAIRAIDANHAYVDQNKNSKYDSAFEAYITHSTSSSHVLTVILPSGGDGTTFINSGTFNGTMTVKLLKGILKNPRKAGKYTVKADFTSVDPDSGGADDSTDTSPSTFSSTESLTIGG